MVMDQRAIQKIEEHLHHKEVRDRLHKNIERVRDEATVTIGRAARLFGFSESQLRDWEKTGLLKSQRSKEKEGNDQKQAPSGSHGGQRQYSFAELDKLAIIHELIHTLRMSPGSIPTNIDEIWHTIVYERDGIPLPSPHPSGELRLPRPQNPEPIDSRVTTTYRQHISWRHYASRVIWFSLLMLHEEVPGHQAGLILPYFNLTTEQSPLETEDLPRIGPALVGWLGKTRSFYTFLTTAPSFEVASDYTLLRLAPEHQNKNASDVSDAANNNTLIVVERKESDRVLKDGLIIQTVARLLAPLYEDREQWEYHFGDTMNNLVNPNIDFSAKVHDSLLSGLMEMIIRLGGKNAWGTDRWHSCTLLLPDNPQSSYLQHNLVVRVKSDRSPMVMGSVILSEHASTSFCQRAYRGGHIVYQPACTLSDPAQSQTEVDEQDRSLIAFPIGGTINHPLGVLFITSHEPQAFNEDDWRVLRITGRMVEEILLNYDARRQVSYNLPALLKNPYMVDPLFKDFPSEMDFLRDIEQLLLMLQRDFDGQKQDIIEGDISTNGISFIAIDINRQVQETIANNYGDHILRHLHKALGIRIRDLLPAIVNNYQNCKLYHITGGRYNLLLRNFNPDKNKITTERLQDALNGVTIMIKQSELPGRQISLPTITIDLGVTYYPFAKIHDFLLDSSTTAGDISKTLYHSLDSALTLSIDRGYTMAWDPENRTFISYQV